MPDFSQLLQLGQQVQGRLSQLQSELAQVTVTGSAGGGMVKAIADGRGRIRSVRIDTGVAKEQDIEMLEDLVLAAGADAQRSAGEMYRAGLRQAARGIGWPDLQPL